jgi:hypothetical protein
LVHSNSDSDSAKREKEAVTFVICVRTMWYKEKVSNFEIAVAKLKVTLRNVKFATLCPECKRRHKFVAPKDLKFRSNKPRGALPGLGW